MSTFGAHGREYFMSSGYEQIYESLIPKLSKCDFF